MTPFKIFGNWVEFGVGNQALAGRVRSIAHDATRVQYKFRLLLEVDGRFVDQPAELCTPIDDERAEQLSRNARRRAAKHSRKRRAR